MQTFTLTPEQAAIAEYALALHEAASRDIADDSDAADAPRFNAIAEQCHAMRFALVQAFNLDVDF